MSFLRHGEIYPWHEGTISRPCPRPSQWMSFQPVIPGGLLCSRARVRFTSRRHSAAAPASMSTQLHRTVLCDCSGCLSPGVHRTPGRRVLERWVPKSAASLSAWTSTVGTHLRGWSEPVRNRKTTPMQSGCNPRSTYRPEPSVSRSPPNH